MKEEKKEAIRKNIRGGRRRRVSLDDEVRAQQMDGFSGFWTRWGKHLLQTIFFGVTIILICFVGQEPPGLRTLGEVAPENVYSDRSFSYLSEVRKRDAEEWIRSSTPREFTRDFVGEENFAKAMVRLREGLLAIAEITDDSKELALESLVEELKIKFQVVLSEDEARALLSTSIMRGEAFFNLGNKLLSQLHLTGVVKFPSVDQKFLSESNASARINSQMIEFANSLVVYDHENNTRLSNSLIDEYHFLSSYLKGFDTNSTSDFTEVLSGKASVQLREIIEFGDENASFAAQEFRNDIAGELGAFLAKGLRLRSIDRKATTAAQERAIADMEPTVISVQEGEIILRRGDRVTAADLEKYQEYLDLALEDSVLLPKRIFVTIVTLLFGVVYISLVLPKFWSDGPRSNLSLIHI